MPDVVMQALQCIRAPLPKDEYDLHGLIADCLQKADIDFVHEAKLGIRCRIDFLCGDIGLEVKRGRPDKKTVTKQLERYAVTGKIRVLILVSEKSASVPVQIAGVPVYTLSLHKLWGIADDMGEMEEKEDVRRTTGNRVTAETESIAENDMPVPQKEEQPFAVEDYILQSLQEEEIPSFLRSNQDGRKTYGTLSYNARRKCWVIKGDPGVTELAKRLFPGSDGGRRGEARFTAHKRIVGDVNWLMIRYPLEIAEKDKTRWNDALSSARNYYKNLEKARRAAPAAQLTPAKFNGTLRPFQLSGLSWLKLTERALLADEMGLGKTVQALACAAEEGIFPILIVPPAHLTRNWLAETLRFLRIEGREPKVHVIKGLTPYSLPDADVYILHYLLLRGWKEALPPMHFHTVIFDEVQELRRAGSEKYSAASLLSESCERVMGLSGTPIYNYGGEIWNVVNVIDYHFLGDWESFSREWCMGYGNRIVQKPQLLGEYLRKEGLMLRRTKEEVLPELPEKRRLVQQIDADDSVYQHLMAPIWEKLYRWQKDQQLTASQRALLEDQISQEARQATGLAKAPYVCQFVKALLASGEKVLLFAHHHGVMDIYKKELKMERPVFITGRETAAQKEAAVDKFMLGKTDLCCISLRAASGLNLQRATCVVFGELDWSPAVHSQAEDRAHRIGQKDSLLCYYLVSPRGSDADMQEALGLKVSQFVQLMGQQPQGEDREAAGANFARQHVEKLIRQLT
ncbi:MAG: DEAD/DEAH box helicase [Clostridia bacterium]|nr:DEAD/DEAH box helicase [Clostridia bacterium]